MAKRNPITILLVFLSVFLFQAAAHAVSWGSNLESALKNARWRKKPVMVDFYTNWCGWCKKLDSETYTDLKVNRLARDFTCVKVNGDRDKDAVRKYNITGYPTVLFLDTGGKVVQRIEGYRNPDGFAATMQEVLKKVEPAQKAKSVKGRKGVLPLIDRRRPSATKEKAEKADKKKPLFELSGIVYQPKKMMAIVNNMVVKEGDKINGAKVVKITRNKVKLSYKRREIVLKMK
jgi:uncharacterized protein YyaL (SSP411 family)